MQVMDYSKCKMKACPQRSQGPQRQTDFMDTRWEGRGVGCWIPNPGDELSSCSIVEDFLTLHLLPTDCGLPGISQHLSRWVPLQGAFNECAQLMLLPFYFNLFL